MQQSAACNTIIKMSSQRSLQSINKFALLASWIPKHAGLLLEIHLDSWHDTDNHIARTEILALAIAAVSSCVQTVPDSIQHKLLGQCNTAATTLSASLTPAHH